jgi:tryptophan synthase beta chain
VRDFHACIGKETRQQAQEAWGGKPDILIACVGGGSNAMGLFHEFVDDKDVRLIGVEAGEAACLLADRWLASWTGPWGW